MTDIINSIELQYGESIKDENILNAFAICLASVALIAEFCNCIYINLVIYIGYKHKHISSFTVTINVAVISTLYFGYKTIPIIIVDIINKPINL